MAYSINYRDTHYVIIEYAKNNVNTNFERQAIFITCTRGYL